jgi:hypothetical protein
LLHTASKERSMPRKSEKKRQSSASGGGRRTRGQSRIPRREELYRPPPDPTLETAALTPLELYRREKARRLGNPSDTSDLLEEARREYKALLIADAAKGKGGRPRKNAARPAPHTDADEAEDPET